MSDRFRLMAQEANARQTGRDKPKNMSKARRGMDLERHLERQHQVYRGQWLKSGQVGGNGVVVVKVPTPMVPGGMRDGKQIFRSGKKVVDYLGALEDREAVAIEAKQCKKHRWNLREASDGQREFMRQWNGIGLIILWMNGEIGNQSAWAIPFNQYLAEWDNPNGQKSWPLPDRRSPRHPGERSLVAVGVRLVGFDWHRALRTGRLDPFLPALQE